jgi:putative PEP-CTERM system TPR-repeat lipoprotein
MESKAKGILIIEDEDEGFQPLEIQGIIDVRNGGKLLRNILAALIVFFSVSACADKTKEALLEEGLKLMDKNNPRGAIVLFRNALQKDQNFFEARFHLARAYFKRGDYDSAEKELQKVIRQSPSLRDAHIMLGRVYLRKLKPDYALKAIAELIASDDADAIEIAGLAHAEKGDYSHVMELLEKSVSFNKNKVTSGIALARVYMKMGKTGDAMSRITEALREDPSNISALYVLAELQTRKNDLDAAVDTFERILKDRPSDPEALFRKGMLHMKAGQYDEALSASDEIIENFSDMPEGYKLKGIALLYKNNFSDSMVFLQKSLSIRPDGGGHYFLGLCHYHKRELEQAMSQLYRALDFDPSFARARALISLILLMQKRVDDAITEIRRVIRTDGGNAFAHVILGNAYMAKGMYDEGIKELDRALEIDPEIVDAHIKKGLFNLSGGRLKEAEMELQTALRVDPEVLNTRVILASFYIRQKEYDRAIGVLKEGIKGGNADAVLYNLIASALSRQNKFADAVRYLRKAKDSNPDLHATYFNLASLYFLSGEHDRAVLELKSVIEKSKDDLKALLSIACIYELKGNEKKALEYFLRAGGTGKVGGYMALAKYYLREGEPDNAIVVLRDAVGKKTSSLRLHGLLGGTFLSLKRFKDAIKSFEDIERISPGKGLPFIVNAHILMNKPEKAMRRVHKELREDPERLDLMAQASRIYMAMGKKQEAIENAGRIISKNPESPVGYLVLGMIYKDCNPDRAIEALERGIEANEKNMILYMRLGDLYAVKKDYDSALDAYHKAEKIKSMHIQAVFRKGTVLHAAGRREKAAAEYLRVIRLSKNHVRALNNIACLYAEDGRHLFRSLQYASRAYIIDSADVSVLDTLGYVLLKNGRPSEAVNMLKKAVRLAHKPSVYYHLSLAYRAQGDRDKALENIKRALGLDGFAEREMAKLLLSELSGGPEQ